MICWYDNVIANKRTNTTAAIGIEYQIAAADKVTRTVVICSGPYATDDIASEESMANALNLVKCVCPSSRVFNGFPIKTRFK